MQIEFSINQTQDIKSGSIVKSSVASADCQLAAILKQRTCLILFGWVLAGGDLNAIAGQCNNEELAGYRRDLIDTMLRA